ncbi:MAG: DUF3455 domain-containing protein [Rhizobacter sp.]|nr:DUF3455 domain-containing protein [Ferruginibacter sp.]
MHLKQNGYLHSALAITFLVTALVACNREKETITNSPAYPFIQSEKLIIPAAIALPQNLPGGNSRVATYFAEGVQKYRSQQIAGSSPATYEWIFVAPQANLYDINGDKVGTHSAGPSWQLTGVNDSIYGQQFSPPQFAPGTDASSIDWLLLKPQAGRAPTGIFEKVSYIQRIATAGGKAPFRLPNGPGETVDVIYTAMYRFTKINP